MSYENIDNLSREFVMALVSLVEGLRGTSDIERQKEIDNMVEIIANLLWVIQEGRL